jgi:hypothetical protein
MKLDLNRIILLSLLSIIQIESILSQTDSLIKYSDLRYHSEFERKSVRNYIQLRNDTFNLFLAIDEKMTLEKAIKQKEHYNGIISELESKNIYDKKINKKIKLTYSTVHSRFLDKYNENEYFPVLFETGIYNCVSASMLFALVFNDLKIPYEVKASSSHVYLIANPGSNSIVIETTNPGFEKAIFTGEFKQQYVNYLRSSKLISESEYKQKSVEEIFEEKFKEVNDAEFINLPGFQYYNKALAKLRSNEIDEALTLCQKAYFFYPVNQVKTLLYTCLIYQIEKCKFMKVSDIDYLAQFTRFENADIETSVAIFNNIIYNHLQYTDREKLCDSICQRYISQLDNDKLIEEIEFAFNLQMSYRFQNSDKIEKYIGRAVEIKGNHHDAKVMMENHLSRKLYSIYEPSVLLDTIQNLKERYKNDWMRSLLSENELRAYLQIATESFNNNKLTSGNEYLLKFENNCETPIQSENLRNVVEITYHSIANYYYYRGYRTKAKSYIQRGLNYVPNSRILKSFNY